MACGDDFFPVLLQVLTCALAVTLAHQEEVCPLVRASILGVAAHLEPPNRTPPVGFALTAFAPCYWYGLPPRLPSRHLGP